MQTLTVFLLLLEIWMTSLPGVASVECPPAQFEVDGPLQIGDTLRIYDQGYLGILTINPSCHTVQLNGTDLILMQDIGCITTVVCSYGFLCNNTLKYDLIFSVTEADLNAPEFSEPEYNISVSELHQVGTSVYSFSDYVTDKDCGTRDFRYDVLGAQGYFRFKASTSPELILNATLDYEKIKQFTFNVTVLSNGKVGVAQVAVTVEDADDMDPVFDTNSYQLSVVEEAGSGDWQTTVKPVYCYDRDFGINETVVYTFPNGTSDDRAFQINESTGQIRIKESLDRETDPTYSLLIKCSQENDPLRSATATVLVTVSDVNDNLPSFVQTSYNVTAMENTPVNFITQISVIDPDEGENAAFHFELLDHTDIIEVNSLGVLSLIGGKQLDRESDTKLVVTIRAVDNFGNYSANNATVTITVLDMNDNSPVFESSIPQVIRFNTTTVGTVIAVVSATDQDQPDTPNSNVTYGVTSHWTDGDSDAVGYFPLSITPSSGEIQITDAVIINTVYNMFIKACDNPAILNDRRCTSIILKAVHVSSNNVTTLELKYDISENVPLATVIDRFPVTGDRYSVDSEYFRVDEQSDLLLTNGDLDRENVSSHSFGVEVYSLSSLIGNVSVIVTVADVNDNVPMFDAPNYDFTFPDPQKADTSSLIGQLNSTDIDSGENGNVTYSLHNIPTALAGMLSINPVEGEVTVLAGWQSLQQSLYRMSAVVTDHGTPALRSFVPLTLSHVTLDDAGSSTIRISTPSDIAWLQERASSLETDISTILNVAITIERFEAAMSDVISVRSFIYLTPLVNARSNGMSLVDVKRLVLDSWEDIQALFQGVQAHPLTHDNIADFGVSEVALIIMASLVLIGTAICIAVICKQYDKNEKNTKLFHNMSRRNTLYDSQELQIDFKDEDVSSRQNTSRHRRGQVTSSAAIELEDGSFGFNNPSFHRDVEGTPRIPRWSASDSINDAMRSLEDLTNRLNAEDNLSRVSSMSRTRKAEKEAVKNKQMTAIEGGQIVANGDFQPTPDYSGSDAEDWAYADDPQERDNVFMMETAPYPDSDQLKRVIEMNSPDYDGVSLSASSIIVEESSTAF